MLVLSGAAGHGRARVRAEARGQHGLTERDLRRRDTSCSSCSFSWFLRVRSSFSAPTCEAACPSDTLSHAPVLLLRACMPGTCTAAPTAGAHHAGMLCWCAGAHACRRPRRAWCRSACCRSRQERVHAGGLGAPGAAWPGACAPPTARAPSGAHWSPRSPAPASTHSHRHTGDLRRSTPGVSSRRRSGSHSRAPGQVPAGYCSPEGGA